jgi:hypothetical protein
MVVDASMPGLTVVVTGNEIYVSKALFDHPSVLITNSLEQKDQASNPRSLYNAEVFPTVAYLICQNHTTFRIVGELDEPIYVKYKADYEVFYSSVLVFDVAETIDVEIVEEIESYSALNSVTNYVLRPTARLNLTTFYLNHVSGISFVYRHIIAQEDSKYSHMVFGKGSSNAIDENKVNAHHQANVAFNGIVNSNSQDFHTIVYVQPASDSYKVDIDYRDVVYGSGNITFLPIVLGQIPEGNATVTISNINLDKIPRDRAEGELKRYLSDMAERATLVRMEGAERFNDNKSKFLHFP